MVILPNHGGNLFIAVKSSFSPSPCSVTTLPITNTPTSGSLATAIHSPSQLPYQFNPVAGYNLQNLTFSIPAIVLAAASLLVSYIHLTHEKQRRSQTRRTQGSETGSLHELSSGLASQTRLSEAPQDTAMPNTAEAGTVPQDTRNEHADHVDERIAHLDRCISTEGECGILKAKSTAGTLLCGSNHHQHPGKEVDA